jgi:nitrate/TMAO reductase-like tetraheme cytochrome c subunit
MGLLERIQNNPIVRNLWARLVKHWRAALAVSIVVFGAASVMGYRAYTHMEHDNRFCTSCHLMDDPYKRFAASKHSTIECHDCHKSTRIEQMEQLYQTVFKNPAKIQKHASVPNAVCVACHESGDSTQWKQVKATAGHRMHMESRDPRLKGLQCIVCHGGTDLHSFAPVQKTCGRAGCHVNQHIRLGRMGDLQLYCATCHDYLARATDIVLDSLGRALTPQAQQCLSCHAMRQRLGDMEIAADPHRGRCGLCHNPHKQTTAQGAITSCTSAGCHTRTDTLAFHKGIPHPEQCVVCHKAHSFRVEGADCTRCHRNIPREPTTRSAAGRPIRDLASTSWDAQVPAAPTSPAGAPRASHGDHRGLKCSACHDSQQRHGALRIRSINDCRGCHHVGAARADCSTCHRNVRPSAPRAITFTLNAGNRSVTHTLRFAHTPHTKFECSRCHTATADRAPTAGDCAGCHADHHATTTTCAGCHQGSAAILAKHKLADHANCAAAGCHGQRGATLPNNRAFCLVCHATQQNHRPGRVCNDCHRVRAA